MRWLRAGWLWLGVWLVGLAAAWPQTLATPTVTPDGTATRVSSTASVSPVGIVAPARGAVLQGRVTIHGRTAAPGFLDARLELGYGPGAPAAWFLLALWTQPQVDTGPLYTWDTTTVADGTYWLRLVVRLRNGQVLQHVVPVQVRNWSTPEPTPTPVATARAAVALLATATPTVTPWPLPPTAVAAHAAPARGPEPLAWAALAGVTLALLLAWRGLLQPPS
ncbi:MAG: hypothetical protein GXO54_03515 [Chloroflexi bacterium]|nr:hypothetical protein [Chloroflexota bacterium]